jgi:hypothetical protein
MPFMDVKEKVADELREYCLEEHRNEIIKAWQKHFRWN